MHYARTIKISPKQSRKELGVPTCERTTLDIVC
jgi:hypothetical protein